MLSALAMLILLPFGILAWAGTSKRTWHLGYLTREEATDARQYLAIVQQNLLKQPPEPAAFPAAFLASVIVGATAGAVFGCLQNGYRLSISEWFSRSPEVALIWATAGAVVAGMLRPLGIEMNVASYCPRTAALSRFR